MEEKKSLNFDRNVFTPFLRRFTDERAQDLKDTQALYERVRAKHLASRWGQPEAIVGVHKDIDACVAEKDLRFPGSDVLYQALTRCRTKVLALESTIFDTPEGDWPMVNLSTTELVDLRRFLRAQEHFLDNRERVYQTLVETLALIDAVQIDEIPLAVFDSNETGIFSVPLITLLENPNWDVESLMGTFEQKFRVEQGLFTELNSIFDENLYEISGFRPETKRDRPWLVPSKCDLAPVEMAEAYLKGTPYLDYYLTPVPYVMPEEARFEHMHIVAGSGHGKTQTLEHLIMHDLRKDDPPSLVIIDGQGDMIRRLSRLDVFDPDNGPLRDKLLIIDPTDLDYPAALNLFDVRKDRLENYSPVAREQILNGVIELYDYAFGSLLGAELTQKQSVVFRYLARLMITIPGSTIHDLLKLMEDATPYLPHIDALPPGPKAFFDLEFNDKAFNATKQQIRRRLWGILENPTFERMMTAKENRIDMFKALNSGKIVLVNTAKDFLKSERSSLLGRTFIMLTMQAAFERAALPANQRRPAFLVIDEAADYFDSNIDDLLTQARKFNLGVVAAHQYLGQLTTGLKSSLAANTSIKMAGGVSNDDARALAKDMRTTPEVISDQRKRSDYTSFATYIRNHTDEALSLSVPFGTLDKHPTMSERDFERVLNHSRRQVSITAAPQNTEDDEDSYNDIDDSEPEGEGVTLEMLRAAFHGEVANGNTEAAETLKTWASVLFPGEDLIKDAPDSPTNDGATTTDDEALLKAVADAFESDDSPANPQSKGNNQNRRSRPDDTHWDG